MIKDYWVFQERETHGIPPWALYIVKEYENPPTLENTRLDVTIYSEDIGNDEHCISFINWQFDCISDYTDEIQWHIEKFAPFTADDYRQVDKAIFKIFMDN